MTLSLPPLFTVLGVTTGAAFGAVLLVTVGLPDAVVPLFPIGGGVLGLAIWSVSDLPLTTGPEGGIP